MSFKLNIRGRDDLDDAPVANLASPLIQVPSISKLAVLASNDDHDSAPIPKSIGGFADLANFYKRPDPLAWLRQFIGEHTVPVTVVRDAANAAGIPWLSILSLKNDWLIEQLSMDKLYWKFPKR